MTLKWEDASTGSAAAWRINPDEHDERRQAQWDEQQRLHPPPSTARTEMLERLESRARRLGVVARDVDEHAREEQLQVRRLRDVMQMKQRLAAPRPVRPDPGEVERLETTERNAQRLAAEAEELSRRANAARQVAAACTRYLHPEQVGGPDDSRFTIRAGRR